MELTERQKGLLTLLCDKINSHGYMMGAHHNKNWHTQQYYQHSPESERMQGTLDRIGKVTYHKSFLVDKEKHDDMFNPCYLGPDLYKHDIRCHWREPFGKGWGPNPPEVMLGPYSSMVQDKAGNWHSPCDTGIWIILWHPTEQNGHECGEGQESIGGCWNLGPQSYPRWRPTYHYTDAEVKEALEIMAQTFGWEYEEGGNMGTMILRHADEEAVEPTQ